MSLGNITEDMDLTQPQCLHIASICVFGIFLYTSDVTVGYVPHLKCSMFIWRSLVQKRLTGRAYFLNIFVLNHCQKKYHDEGKEQSLMPRLLLWIMRKSLSDVLFLYLVVFQHFGFLFQNCWYFAVKSAFWYMFGIPLLLSLSVFSARDDVQWMPYVWLMWMV